MKPEKIEVTQEMLEQALLCCLESEPTDHYPCEDCYLYPLRGVDDDCMPDGIVCSKHLALDAIAYIRRINDFEKSQCAQLLAKLGEETSRRYQAECNYDHAIKDRDTFKRALEIMQHDLPNPWTPIDRYIRQAQEQEGKNENFIPIS